MWVHVLYSTNQYSSTTPKNWRLVSMTISESAIRIAASKKQTRDRVGSSSVWSDSHETPLLWGHNSGLCYDNNTWFVLYIHVVLSAKTAAGMLTSSGIIYLSISMISKSLHVSIQAVIMYLWVIMSYYACVYTTPKLFMCGATCLQTLVFLGASRVIGCLAARPSPNRWV